MIERHGFRVEEIRYTNALPLMVPFAINEHTADTLWAANQRLSRMPGVRLLANNIELVARATG